MPEKWDPLAETTDESKRNRCQNCGSHVMDSTRRVYGDDEGYVHACPECAINGSIERDSWANFRSASVATDGGEDRDE